MNTIITDNMKAEFESQVQAHTGLPAAKVAQVFDVGKDTIVDTLKQEALSGNINGIVSMFTSQKDLDGNDTVIAKVIKNLSAALQKKEILDQEQSDKVSAFAVPQVANKVKHNFNTSGHSQDLNGLADFIGIDKNLLKIAGSPVGKLFGKFF